jgi:fused signal recognition particle receptor
MLKKWFKKKGTDAEAQPTDEAANEDAVQDEASPRSSPAAISEAEPEPETQEEKPKKSRWSFLTAGFKKTRAGLQSLFGLKGKLNDDILEQIEAELYTADFGPGMVDELIDGEEGLRAAWKAGDIENQEEVLDFMKTHLKTRLMARDSDLKASDSGPTVFLVAGVNGTGKTTSIAKLANRLLSQGNTVLLAAADTFRAAAVEQLTIWSQRLGIGIQTGGEREDPASVAYKAVERAIEENIDYLIVDTAGRLHTDKNLMRELVKIRQVVAKKLSGAPHESLLVLDSTNGQNAIQQAEIFKREIEITGIILTKLDGTAKGGVVFTIHERLDIPVKFVGLGEGVEDLADFNPEGFVDALFES